LNVDRKDQFPLVEGEPAFLLEEGVAYVRGWAAAQHAVSALKQILIELGQEDAVPRLRADVNVLGAGMVELGYVTPETATLITEALRMKRTASGQNGCAA
jgi:hypothetical protein